MNTKTHNSHKNTNLLSYQVRQILTEKGYSFLFNWDDYYYFKSLARTAFNKANEIANLFILETNTKSDFDEYVY